MIPRAILFGIAMALLSCEKPVPQAETPRPDQVVDFRVLFLGNCSACHGADGKGGAAISLNNRALLRSAGIGNLQQIIYMGVPGTMMPAFARSSGGTLTDSQVSALAAGLIKNWGGPATAAKAKYAVAAGGDLADGQRVFDVTCVSCHAGETLTNPAYLSLISNQGLRNFIQFGHPGRAPSLTEAELTDTVAWLASKRPGRN